MKKLALATTAALTILAPSAATATTIEDSENEYIQLSWDEENYTASTTETFVGTPMVVPGASNARTLSVMNTCPTTAVLTGEITNVENSLPGAADVHHNPDHQDPDGSGADIGDPYEGAGDQGDFYEDLQLAWTTASSADAISFNEAEANVVTPILNLTMEPGEVTDITIGYDFPYEATSGNRANVEWRESTFDTHFELVCEVMPAITLSKTHAEASDGSWDMGDTITYDFVATNTGNVELHDVTITETEFSGSGEIGALQCQDDSSIAPGETFTCTADYIVTEADARAGAEIINRASVTGTDNEGQVVTGSDDDTFTPTVPGEDPPPFPDPSGDTEQPRPDLEWTGANVTAAGLALALILGGLVAFFIRRKDETA